MRFWSCNINFKGSKNIPVIFHNLICYYSHLIVQKICKYDVNIPDG